MRFLILVAILLFIACPRSYAQAGSIQQTCSSGDTATNHSSIACTFTYPLTVGNLVVGATVCDIPLPLNAGVGTGSSVSGGITLNGGVKIQ